MGVENSYQRAGGVAFHPGQSSANWGVSLMSSETFTAQGRSFNAQVCQSPALEFECARHQTVSPRNTRMTRKKNPILYLPSDYRSVETNMFVVTTLTPKFAQEAAEAGK